MGDSTPDMEKLVAISDLFDVSLDMLIMGKEAPAPEAAPAKSELVDVINQKVLTPNNKKKAKSALKTAGIIAGIILLIDFISAIIFFALNGFPM